MYTLLFLVLVLVIHGEKSCVYFAFTSFYKIKKKRVIEVAVISLLLFLIHIHCLSYRKNSENKPWACICSKGFSARIIFGGAYYWRKFCVSK